MQFTPEFKGLWKHQNYPSSTKTVKRTLKKSCLCPTDLLISKGALLVNSSMLLMDPLVRDQ